MSYRRIVLIQCLIVSLATWVPATDSNIHKKNYKYKRDVSPFIVSESRMNLCDFTQNNMKVRCYCEYGGEEDDSMNSPNKADCWVMNGTVRHDDPIWEAFKSFPKLQRLSFTLKVDSTIDLIPKSAFRHLKSIKNINIKYANVKLVEAHTFENLPTLENIDLSRNDIEEVKPYAFSNLSNVTVIFFDDNHLTEIRRDVFYNLPALQKLYITNNNINVIHDGAFKHVPNLLELEVDRNVIFVLTRATFKGLGKLTLLTLSNNKIEMLGDHTFAEMPNLEDLSLDNNNIQLITDKAFFGLQKLKRLSISDNKLTTLMDPMVFADLKSLISLDLRYTALTTLPYDVVKPILPNMWGSGSMFYLEGNNFDCNCHIDWMVDLHNKSTSHRISIGFQEFTCNIDPVLGKNIQEQILAARAAKEQIEIEQENQNKESRPYGDDEYYEDEYEPQPEMESSPRIEIINKLHLLEIPSDMMPCDDVDGSEMTMKNEILPRSSHFEAKPETTTPTSPATKIDEVSAKPKILQEAETSEIYPYFQKDSSHNMMFNSLQRNEKSTVIPEIEAEIPVGVHQELDEEPSIFSQSREKELMKTEEPLQSAIIEKDETLKNKHEELNEEPMRFTESTEEELIRTQESVQSRNIENEKLQKENDAKLNIEPRKFVESSGDVQIETEENVQSRIIQSLNDGEIHVKPSRFGDNTEEKVIQTKANIEDRIIQKANDEEVTGETPPRIAKAGFVPAYKSNSVKESDMPSSAVSNKSVSGILCILLLTTILSLV